MKPDFICIGAGKAGTSWLHKQLIHHKDVSLPYVKELHHLDNLSSKRRISFTMKKSVFGTYTRSAIVRGIITGKFVWLYKFLFNQRTIENYQNLFSQDHNKLSGEVCPSYALLSKDTIEKFSYLNPDCKIIYILRNPVARIWSHLNMIKKRKRIDFSDEGIYNRINERHHRVSDYLTNLSNWESYFPKQSIHICFFDELESDPELFLNNMYTFLGVNRDLSTNNTVHLGKKSNKGTYSAIPLKFKKELTNRHYSSIQKLHMRFKNNYTLKWLEDATQLINE